MKNVLLIDDDIVCNFITEKTLQLTGLATDIQSATSGQEALQMFNGCYKTGIPLPDLIFLDINMPIMNGFEFLKAFNKLAFQSKEKITFVIVSSSYNTKDIELARSLGVLHYRVKPLTAADMIILLTEEPNKAFNDFKKDLSI